VEWAIKSAQFAFNCGAGVVSLIPTRAGNGALDLLMKTGEFRPPSLCTFERSLDGSLALLRGRVFADLWDLERFSRCPRCFAARRQRLEQINLTQQQVPSVCCPSCGRNLTVPAGTLCHT
jgi:hypothetical protein